MPELPDIEAYLHALRARVEGQVLTNFRVASFSLLRTFEPPPEDLRGKKVTDLSRLGKRIVFTFDGPAEDRLHLVIHLMVAGRLAWTDKTQSAIPKKFGLAALDFSHGTIILREAGTKKRAAAHLVRGDADLREHDPGGRDPRTVSQAELAELVSSRNRTLKRFLTDQAVLSGIGNAFSDEILLEAKLSPTKRTSSLTAAEISRLREAMADILNAWTRRLVDAAETEFPKEVTAFREDFAAHGKFGIPCPECGTAIARIRYASNETNYCPTCQNDGVVLKDRGLSRLLGDDWPREVEA